MRLSCFLLGLAVLWIAVASPLDGFADVLLSAHMVQHLLLMSAVPPLLLLGWPVVPLLRGLPAWILRPVLGPLLRLAVLRRLGRWLISPPGSVAGDEPGLSRLACARGLRFCAHTRTLARVRAHLFSREFTRILVVHRPAMANPASDGTSWGLVLYLLSADLVNTALSAFLAFCDWPVYRYYLTQPNPFHVSPLSDQVLGAVIMWVGGSFVFLVPATLITFTLLQAPSTRMA